MHSYIRSKFSTGFDVIGIDNLFQMNKGFSSWKDATIAFYQNELSKANSEAVVVLPRAVDDISVTLSAEHVKEKEQAKDTLKLILSSVLCLAR